MEEGRRVLREERGKMCAERVFKKLQVVYYLSRSNGQLDHPHFIEVTHLAHQQLRLKDVLDRLTVLRGKGMPSLYSWSCKRSYKNGYVWNDLGQNDVIFPVGGAGGGEYVLKGSELPLLAACTAEKLHHLQLGNFEHENNPQRDQDSNLPPKRRFIASKRQIINHQETINNQYGHDPDEEEYEDKTMHTRCSTNVPTEEQFKHSLNHTILETNSHSSPPSTTSSSTLSDKKSEEGDPIANEPMLSRNSMLFNLIACGGSGSFRKNELPPLPPRKSVQKVVVGRAAKEEEEEQDHEMIKYISENPRFGNLLSEDKEYFSGSIVESITNEQRPQTGLQKSSSYNHQRSSKIGVGEEVQVKEEKKKKGGVKGKCIPRNKKKSKQDQN